MIHGGEPRYIQMEAGTTCSWVGREEGTSRPTSSLGSPCSIPPTYLPPCLFDANLLYRPNYGIYIRVLVAGQRFDADMWIHQGILWRARYVDANILPGSTELDVVGEGRSTYVRSRHNLNAWSQLRARLELLYRLHLHELDTSSIVCWGGRRSLTTPIQHIPPWSRMANLLE